MREDELDRLRRREMDTSSATAAKRGTLLHGNGSGIAGNKLVYVWPVDGKTYPDPLVRNAHIRYAEFEPAEKPPGHDGMQPFAWRRTGVANGAPTETVDLARVRAFRWEDKNLCASSMVTRTGTPVRMHMFRR